MSLSLIDRLMPSCVRLDQRCPANPCRGAGDPGACDHWHRLNGWRAVPPGEQAARAEAATRVQVDPRLRDAVLECRQRGSVLPIAEQDDCGCRGRELTACHAGRGAQPGKVTLADCLACRAVALSADVT